MKTLRLKIEQKSIKLTLTEDQSLLVTQEWQDENNLLEVFFDHLETVIGAADCKKYDIATYELDSDLASGFTTQRIAATLIRTLEYAKNQTL